MSKLGGRKAYQNLATVAAGDATDATFSYYISLKDFRKLGLHLEWTAGSGGGTITVTLEGSMQSSSTVAGASSLDYQDVTNAAVGVASFTDDFILSDDDEFFAAFMWVKVKVVVANKDSATAWTLDSTRVG